MSEAWDEFAEGAIASWMDWRSGTLLRAMAGGSSTWWAGYRSLLRRPPAERAAFIRSLYRGATGSGPAASRPG